MTKIYAIAFAALLAGAAVMPAEASQAFGRRAVKSGSKARAEAGAPVVLPATDITSEGFTANWQSTGADGYALFVYSKEKVSQPGNYFVLQENFNLISQGSQIEPVFTGEFATTLTPDQTFTPDWTVIECSFAGGKVGGLVLSPYMDLTHDGGKFTVVLGVVGFTGQQIQVESNGFTKQTKTATLTEPGYNEIELEFDNGTHDTYVTYVDLGFPDDTEGMYFDKVAYLDDFAVFQKFEAGDEILHLVATADSEETSYTFDTLPYRYDATRLYYDVYGTTFVYNDPDDPWDYDVFYSPFSDLQEVRLTGDPDDQPDVAISDVSADAAAPAEYFNLQGVRLSNPSGLVIRRQGSETTKVFIP